MKNKKHTIVVKESDWSTSKFRTKEWESRVNIIKWEHDYEEAEYRITIG
jgi:hypothetical protein